MAKQAAVQDRQVPGLAELKKWSMAKPAHVRQRRRRGLAELKKWSMAKQAFEEASNPYGWLNSKSGLWQSTGIEAILYLSVG